MRRILLLFITLVISIPASAQYMITYPDVAVKGHKVFVGGERVSDNYVMKYLTQSYGEDVADAWSRNVKVSKIGRGLTVGGAILGGCGTVAFGTGIALAIGGAITLPIIGMASVVVGDPDYTNDYISDVFGKADILLTVGGTCVVVGGAMLLVGVPMRVVCKRKAKNIIYAHTNCFIDDYQLTFGLQNNGIGLALNF